MEEIKVSGDKPTIQMTAEDLKSVLADIIAKAQHPEWQQPTSIDNTQKKANPNVTKIDMAHKAKVLKNRLTRFNGKYISYTITKDGVVKV